MLPCDAQFQALALSASWRGKLQRLQSWRRVWQTAACAKLLSGPTLEPSMAARFMAEWTESLAVSRALTSALLEDKPDSMETPADCFSSTCESFAKFSHDGSLLKTSRQFSLFQQEEPYSENLPRSGSMRNGELYERPMLAPRTDGTGRSSWPTPRTGAADKTAHSPAELDGRHWKNLNATAAQWPTPRTEDSESCGNHPGAMDLLTGATRQWATPNAHDGRRPGVDAGSTQGGNLNRDAALWKTPDVPNGGRTMSAVDVAANGATDKGKRQVGLENQVCHSFPQAQPTPTHGAESLPSAPTSRRRLNPAFVDWLMGLPPGWTDYAPVETALWFSRVRSRLVCLLDGQD